MRGIPLRCPYLYTIKRNKSVSDFSYLQTYYTRKDFMEEISLYEKIVSSEIGFIIMDLNRYGGIWSVEDICQCIEQKNIE